MSIKNHGTISASIASAAPKQEQNVKNASEALMTAGTIFECTNVAYPQKKSFLPSIPIVRELKSSINYGKYGKFYKENIPKNEKVSDHIKLIDELSNLSKKIQGCKINNPAPLNGITAKDFQNKIIKTAQKIVNGETFGKNQKTLVLATFAKRTDNNKGFDEDCQLPLFTSNNNKIAKSIPLSYEKSFFDNYDNIIFIQPTSVNSDTAMNNTFSKLEKCLNKGSEIDIAIMGHGQDGNGIILSYDFMRNYKEKHCVDVSDFKKGDAFTKSIKNLFKNAIDNNKNPKLIGLGCESEFLQECVNLMFDKNYSSKVKVFSTPYDVNRNFSLGFNNDNLEMNFLTSSVKDKKGLFVTVTDSGEIQGPKIYKTDRFILNPQIMDEITKNSKTGSMVKTDNGMVMQYTLMKYN